MISYKVKYSIAELSDEWDRITPSFFLSIAFLKHLHDYNFCDQRYYEMYDDNHLIAFTVVYTLPIDIFTYSRIKSVFKVNIVGIPVSVASEPIAGDSVSIEKLFKHILREERGLLLGLNFTRDILNKGPIKLRTLPTIIFQNDFEDIKNYLERLRYPYRRKLKLSQRRFQGVCSKETLCTEFSTEHYELYTAIMGRTKTKLETLSKDFFQNLSNRFILTSHYHGTKIVCWNICLIDRETLFFFFGGLNYELRDEFRSYYNNLLSIVDLAIKNKVKNIDFGQTAELPKLRMGGELSERRMFLYHRNIMIRQVLKLMKGFIGYTARTKIPHAIKNE